MTEKKVSHINEDELRRLAEVRLGEDLGTAHPPRTEAESLRLLHELEVHQIELVMQNEELRQAREKEAEALEKYIDLYDFAPVGYFTFDRQGVIHSVNLSGASFLGIERSRLVGQRFGLFVAGTARPAFTAFLRKVFESPAKEACEMELLKGGKHSLFVQIQAVVNASGLKCRAVVIDISVRRQLEEKIDILYSKLQSHATELEGANIELEAFNSMVAHDLRTPLNNINGLCQVMQQFCAEQNAECKGYVQGIYEATLQMDWLINTLLKFSRTLHAEMHRDKVDLSGVAREVAASLERAETERQVTFRIANGIVVMGDAKLLNIVLENLIGNAWKYSGNEEGTVIEFGVIEREGKLSYFVRDNGPGFDMAYAEKLFIPFQRLPGAKEFKGNGIGLATVERIIKRHGGRIWAESERGKGATFYFTL
jgi:PAS domain S-box-containing protein